MPRPSKSRRPNAAPAPSLVDSIGQLAYPPEHRIRAPRKKRITAPPVADLPPPPPPVPDVPPPVQPGMTLAAVAEVATCLWYVKTKHFKRSWSDDDTRDDDQRVRVTLGRLNRGIRALADAGVVVRDPVGERYPAGGEAWMRPIQFEPTAGTNIDTVAQTIRPIIYFDKQMIQRAEVFVAVPISDASPAEEAAPAEAAPAETIETVPPAEQG